MVFGLISLAATIPMTTTSVLSLQDQAERSTGQQKPGTETATSSAWMRNKAHIRTRATRRTPDDRKRIFERDSHLALRDGRLYVQLESERGTAAAAAAAAAKKQQRRLHPFTGYYVPYPDAGHEGLVSTISDDPPQLNWVFVDPATMQVRHGLRVEAERALTGPWGAKVVDGEKHVLWAGWEGFLAVETDEPGLWGLYFDRDDSGLSGRFEEDRRIVEIELLYAELEADGKPS